MAPHTVITKASKGEEVLVMHSYILDPEAKIVRLDTSASHFRNAEDKEHRALVGRANKFLHYYTMLHFKEQGINTYDFGGYALDTKDPGLKSINRFKDAFKGQLVEEYTYTPLPLFLAKKILR